MEPFDLTLLDRERHALQTYTRDLTDAALRDELEPVRCRDAETDRVIAILLRQSKNNPVLVGEAGMGKTAIVEGLAQGDGERFGTVTTGLFFGRLEPVTGGTESMVALRGFEPRFDG